MTQALIHRDKRLSVSKEGLATAREGIWDPEDFYKILFESEKSAEKGNIGMGSVLYTGRSNSKTHPPGR